MNKLTSIILDADICIKLSKVKDTQALYDIISKITKKAYIHEYVYNEEILINKSQINMLISKGMVELIYPDKDLDEIDYQVYKDARGKMCIELIGVENPPRRTEHLGEAYSLALAKALAIPIFMSDESELQVIINRVLNTGIRDINVFRIKDIVCWIRDNKDFGFNKKDAKRILFSSSDREHIPKLKKWLSDNWQD